MNIMEGGSIFIEVWCWREAAICIVFMEFMIIHLSDAPQRGVGGSDSGRDRETTDTCLHAEMTTALGAGYTELPRGRVGGMREDSLTKQDCNAKPILKMNLGKKEEKNAK
jgi:hypothetical protein